MPKSVVIITDDPERSYSLATPFRGPETRVVAARTPLEGLWSAPEVEAVVLDRGADVEVVPI